MQPRSEEKISNQEWVTSVCYMCFNACGIKVQLQDGTVIAIDGHPDFPNSLGKLCAKGKAGVMGLYNPDRVTVPLKRTNPEKGIGIDPKWVEISWDEAMDTITEKLGKIREEDPRKLLTCNMDFPIIPQHHAFAAAFGTVNVGWNGAGFFCGNGYHPLMYLTHGTFYQEPDVDYCNYLILMGSQVGFMTHTNSVRMASRMAEARERGMKVVVVDPICATAASKANEWIPIRPGTDAAFALGMLNVLLNELGIYDAEFLRKYTNAPYLVGPDGLYLRDKETNKPLVWDNNNQTLATYDQAQPEQLAVEGEFSVAGVKGVPGFEKLREHVRNYPLEKVSNITSIPAETIRRLAQEYGEAARIGAKIIIDGQELPHRPAAVDYSRGPIAHKHGMLIGMAIQLLNIVIGAVGVPGGQLGLNAVAPTWKPKEGPDGFLVAPEQVMAGLRPYPANEVRAPESMELREIIPLATYGRPLLLISALDPEKFKLPYQLEAMIHCRTNILMTQGNPEATAKVIRRIPFILSFAIELDEATEFADIVLPDTHYLERLDPFPNHPCCWIEAGSDEWYWEFRQPVVDPPGQARSSIEVLMEVADRLGFLGDFNMMINHYLFLKEPYRLDPDKKYTWEEMAEVWIKSMFGPEYGLEWFKQHGVMKFKRKVEEKYPRPFLKPRIHLYFEYFQRAGQAVKELTTNMDIPWDTSDYQPLPDWKPCPAHEDGKGGNGLYAVNFKLPFHTFSYTAGNPWLSDLSDRHPYATKVLISSQAAEARGIKNGDIIRVESSAGKVKGEAWVSQCVHPEVIGIGGVFGHWAKGMPVAKGKGTHFNALLPVDMTRIDPVSTALDACVRVEVFKES